MSVQVAKHSFTVAQYERMGEAGILSENDRVELIEGEIVETSPIGERHAACVDALSEMLREKLQRSVTIRAQNPVRLGEYSEPQPDVAILKRREDFYRNAHPTPADVLLLIEVSDATLEYDRQIKVPLYARAGVPEVWIVNLADERIETYADLAGGVYQTTASAARGEEVQARGVASLRLSVAEVLG
ncbi:MAG TPA: Uma2 family endonuclease [Pyrinomonadaceae bacterium]|nr:Uma2 family endonuclease [Pyrinomonadaceae bacterium]